ncbi:MAG: carbamoyl-phosphate synthase small subunit, partial [Betaproteobacteria bacterium]|nr:carbamoyl-phosphate synthase small subunit [Betaproteobacteria bacterium]
MFPARTQGILALADGTVLRGRAIGASGHAVGEVVFNTAMTGYQEILTDPSYAGQIVTLTYPHIGNVGVNPEDAESRRVFAAGLVVRDVPSLASNWRSSEDLPTYLRRAGVVGIADVDTRRLTRILREGGAQNACIAAATKITDADVADAIARARAAPSMAGLDLAKVVSCSEPHAWTSGAWSLGTGYRNAGEHRFHVVAYDFGIKHNILRLLAER